MIKNSHKFLAALIVVLVSLVLILVVTAPMPGRAESGVCFEHFGSDEACTLIYLTLKNFGLA
ncbi:hypothetical protein OAN80_04760, partial [Alphaproteobacteria bacterium]|nr:hypothetical protein [Alphaproteobacteria bacterium]